jgi:two-component system sensor histidine kinase BaeS
MRRLSLATEVFGAMLLSAFVATALMCFVAYETFVGVVRTVIASVPGLSASTAATLLGQSERAILSSFSPRTYVLVFLAALAAGGAAFVISVRLNRPAKQLMHWADDFTRGDRDRRAPVHGPLEIASLSASFNHLADVLEEEDHLRRKLVADIAHELRNPITVATAQTEAMLSGVLPADTAHLETLLNDLQHLGALMDDMQESAVAESGRWRYDMKPTDLSALLVRNASRTQQRVTPGVEVRLAGADQSAIVFGDELRLDQVLRNILGNAQRHTASGSITLLLEDSAETLTVRVSDTGEGISESDLPHIFERFYRADNARAADSGGAGLGLSIVRAIVRDHGGEVFAESRLGTGTVIGFTLPKP